VIPVEYLYGTVNETVFVTQLAWGSGREYRTQWVSLLVWLLFIVSSQGRSRKAVQQQTVSRVKYPDDNSRFPCRRERKCWRMPDGSGSKRKQWSWGTWENGKSSCLWALCGGGVWEVKTKRKKNVSSITEGRISCIARTRRSSVTSLCR